MLVEQIRNHSLCDELQLGDTLNRCSQQGDLAHFHLLLSMLSQNVCDQAQFSMQKPAAEQVQQDLRAQLQLREARPLIAQADEFEVQANWSQHLQKGSIDTIRLEQALNGYAACADDTLDGVREEVMNNVSLLTRLKHGAASKPLQVIPDVEVKGSEIYQVLSNFDYSKPLKVKYYN
ncbi:MULTISPECIES: VC2046/SO_2500 family protein [unclassified Agarivorans]|uniref:VC2046/SO_2500 family protein n=1 Tax=unclassified Agarivorans TaxID=2636026 RepID=UPI003D7EA0FA